MKTLSKELFIVLSALFLLGACTEEIIIDKIIRDTVYVQRPSLTPSFVVIHDTITIEKELLRIDTVEIQTVVNEHDTVFQVHTDSVFFETVVYKTDTVTIVDTVKVIEQQTVTVTDTVYVTQVDTLYIVEHVYTETQFYFPGNSVTYIPAELQPIFNSYFDDAVRYGKQPPGGDMVVEFVPADNLPGEGWHSNSFRMSGDQVVIQLDETLSPDRSFSCLYRELSRIQLSKKYSTRTGEIMNNLFPVDELKFSDSDAKKLPYLNTLFR